MAEQVCERSDSRDQLIAMGRSGDIYRFLTLADGAVQREPDDPEVRLLLVQRLAEQGLLYRAAEVAAGFPPEMQNSAGFTEMIDSLQCGRNNGLAGWDRCTARYQANMAMLRARYDWADEVTEAWRIEGQYLELHRTRSKCWQVYDRRRQEAGGWRPAFINRLFTETAEQIAEQIAGRVIAPILIDGVGLGYDLPLLFEGTRDTFLGASPMIYQFESCPLALAVVLHLHDWRELIGDPRVRLCVGSGAGDQLEQFIEAELWMAPPQNVVATILWDPQTAGRAANHLASVLARFETSKVELTRTLCARYAERDVGYWRRRYAEALSGRGPSLRVLGITSRFTTVLQYAMRDTLNALQAHGCNTRLLIEPDDLSCLPPARKLEAIAEFDPDLVFCIDHTRLGQEDGMIAGVPFMTWVQDRLPWLFDRAVGRSMGPLDFCMGNAHDELVAKFDYPAGRCFPCDMATDPASFWPEGRGHVESDQEDGRFCCDVAYATHASESPDDLHARLREAAADGLGKRLIDAAYKELSALTARCKLNGALHLPHFLDCMQRATRVQIADDVRASMIEMVLRPLVDRLLRHQTIAWAAAWAEEHGRRFHLYGNGWSEHPEYSRHARGTVGHGPELGTSLRAAKVSLHAGSNSAFHQRVLDGLAAGGFFLIRRHGNDVSHAVSAAKCSAILDRDLKPGDRIRGLDLVPPSLREGWTAVRTMQGCDPSDVLEITEGVIADAKRTCDARVSAAEPQALWPEFDRVTFGSQQELAERLDWFLEHDAERRELASTMRRQMLDVFGYKALMGRVLTWMQTCLGQEHRAR